MRKNRSSIDILPHQVLSQVTVAPACSIDPRRHVFLTCYGWYEKGKLKFAYNGNNSNGFPELTKSINCTPRKKSLVSHVIWQFWFSLSRVNILLLIPPRPRSGWPQIWNATSATTNQRTCPISRSTFWLINFENIEFKLIVTGKMS